MGYQKDFKVRWSEIDPNMHLTSSAYIDYITDTRMDFFENIGFGLPQMKKLKIGPIVLSEKSYYFKEVYPGQVITVDISNAGIDEKGKMMLVEQRIYNEKNQNCFLAYTLVAFLNVIERKMIVPPAEVQKMMDHLPKSKRFKILTKEETRDSNAFPVDKVED